MRHFSTFRGLYIAADAAICRRRARDAEPPTEGELDNEPASTEDLVAAVEEWLADMPPADAEAFLDRLVDLKDAHTQEQGLDRGHRGVRGVRGARRVSGAGDFLDRHVDRAHDSAPTGVKPASERFPGIGRNSSMGSARDNLTA